MGRSFRGFSIVLFTLLSMAIVWAQNDAEGAKDYPGVSRMPGYYIYQYSDSQFDSAPFTVTQKGVNTEQQVEGRLIKIQYVLKDGATATSTLQVVRNYQNAAKTAGGQVLYDESFDSGARRETTLKLAKGGNEIWIGIEARDDHHFLTIIEKKAMQQDVTIDAAALANDLQTTGKVAIYGIYFDSGKSELKTESDPALAQIAKLLKEHPALKVYIVGHTDMVGDAMINVKLSQARAQAVISALVAKHGVANSRMIPFGNGPYAPVASNKAEDGRAKNRRVELVEIATN